MKALKSINFLTLSVSLLCTAVVFSSVNAQEYDDMYFNKSDRKTVKVDKAVSTSALKKNTKSTDYKKISESTETYSAKNVNPEYIARYKSTDSNEVNEQLAQENKSYDSDDYFVEGYDRESYVSDTNKNKIDYTALALRDQMSYSNHNRSYSSPSWRFSPYMSMGMGYGGYGYPGYGYDPYMMGYGSSMSMGIGFGFGSGFGYSPSMSYNIGMSYGSGYNPWGGFGGYPGYYNPYGMRGYDPWRSMAYNRYGSMYGCSPYYGGGYGYGGYPGVIVVSSSSSSDNINGRRMEYKPRTSRSAASLRTTQTNLDNRRRTTASDAKIRVPNRSVSATNGRTSRDYSKVQNEYYNRARQTTSSAQRISTSNSSRGSYIRNSGSSRYSSSTINNNKPSRSSGFSSGNSSSYGKSGNTMKRSSSSSFSSSPRRSSSSFSSGSSGSRSSSFSSGSRSSSSSSGGSRSSGSSSRSGGRQ